MERRRVIINFKNTAEEIALYEQLKKHSSVSGYIKDILKGLTIKVDESNKTTSPLNEDLDINDILGDI